MEYIGKIAVQNRANSLTLLRILRRSFALSKKILQPESEFFARSTTDFTVSRIYFTSPNIAFTYCGENGAAIIAPHNKAVKKIATEHFGMKLNFAQLTKKFGS